MKVVNSVTGKSNVADQLPSGQFSNVPWRRQGVKYASNEAYFDVTEEVDAIIDRSGSIVFAEIQGSINAQVRDLNSKFFSICLCVLSMSMIT